MKKKPLPPDSDGTNGDHAQWAALALRTFRKTTGTDPGDALSDLLGDLMHWCDRHQTDFNAELTRARRYYAEETKKTS